MLANNLFAVFSSFNAVSPWYFWQIVYASAIFRLMTSALFYNRLTAILSDFRERNAVENFSALSLLRSVQPLLQNGPQCGMVALCMAAQSVGLKNEFTVGELMKKAKELGISNHGEIFSADFMVQLFNACNTTEPSSCYGVGIQENLLENFRQLLLLLNSGAALIVPYDNDKNFEPCERRGHVAHWATVIGYLALFNVPIEQVVSSQLEQSQHIAQDPQLSEVYWLQEQASITETVKFLRDPVEIYVYCLHGKSKHISIWSLNKLCLSNAQLLEVGPDRMSDKGLHYVVPERLEECLAKKVVVLSMNAV